MRLKLGQLLSRRDFMNTAISTTALMALPKMATAGGHSAVNQKIIEAAKSAGTADLKGIIWALYYAPMKASCEKFAAETGTNFKDIKDISIFVAPPAVVAEGVAKSPEFDLFHINSNMIPTLASIGMLEELDSYMDEVGFDYNAVGTFDTFMKYKGATYGMPTDGNVHTQFIHWATVEKNAAAYEDKFGKSPTWPGTWEEEIEWMKFFAPPSKATADDYYGSMNLRNRANGATWWFMQLYSAGGFTFDDDMNPTMDTDEAVYAWETYMKYKDVSHPEAPGWGTPQMIPRMTGGKVFSGQYWDGIVALNENPEKSKTVGQWKYGLVPGSDFSGKRIYRSISDPLGALLVNKHSPRKALAAYLAMWLTTEQESEAIVADPANTFHDPWAKSHMTSEMVAKTYTKGGLEGIQQCLQVAAPPIYLTGYMEFTDILNKNLSEAYVGSISVSEGIKKTQEEFAGIVKKTGKRKLKAELESYKMVMPKIDAPA